MKKVSFEIKNKKGKKGNKNVPLKKQVYRAKEVKCTQHKKYESTAQRN